MDELDMLGTLLAQPGPSRDTVDRGRGQLQETMRGTARRHRTSGRWLTAGAGLTAAAAAAVAITWGTTGGAPTPGGHPAAARLSGQQILLAAASTAERAPAVSGTYWHVTTQFSDSPSDRWQTWTGRDGQGWGTKGNKVFKDPFPAPFMLVGAKLSFRQLQDLPTSPAGLKAWIIDNAAEHGGKGGPFGERAPNRTMERIAVFDSLTALVTGLPVPPDVRAAAFRVMASLPGVRSLGPVRGGQGLLIPFGSQQARLVVDPVTARVRDTNFFVTVQGAQVWIFPITVTVTVTAGWTSHPPKVSTLPRR
jgi:hypothetical protein